MTREVTMTGDRRACAGDDSDRMIVAIGALQRRTNKIRVNHSDRCALGGLILPNGIWSGSMRKIATVFAALALAVAIDTMAFAQGSGNGSGGAAGGASPNITGTGTPNVNHTPCGGTSSQSNGTNSGANTFPNSSSQNKPEAPKTSKGC